MVVETVGMGADMVYRAADMGDTVAGDVEVIAAGGETPLPVEAVEAFRGKLAVAPGSGAVHYDKVDVSVTVQTSVGRLAVDIAAVAAAMGWETIAGCVMSVLKVGVTV